MTTTQYPMNTQTLAAITERETSNPNLAAWTEADYDDSDAAFETSLAECQAFAASV